MDEEVVYLYKGRVNEYMNEYMKRKIKCQICDKEITYGNKAKHERTNKHKIMQQFKTIEAMIGPKLMEECLTMYDSD